jgi:hypothetical protein
MWATRQWGTRGARIEVAVSATPLLPDHGIGLLKITYRGIDVENPH